VLWCNDPGLYERDLRRERLERCPREQDLHSQILLLRNEKGGVVRRPFSKLQAWLIAVSPQPGVAVAIGTTPTSLESSSEQETERGSRQAPLTPSPAGSSWEELLLHPSVFSREPPPHRRPSQVTALWSIHPQRASPKGA
jgi:hypothetical protein